MKTWMLLTGLAFAAALGLTIAQNPPAQPQPQSRPTIAQVLAADPEFSTLLRALQAAGLEETLSEPGPLTLLAPTNAAFEKVPPTLMEQLMANRPVLAEVLRNHMAQSRLSAQEVAAEPTLPTLAGSQLPVVASSNTLKVGPATVTRPDLPAANGVIHVIDTVILPRSN